MITWLQNATGKHHRHRSMGTTWLVLAYLLLFIAAPAFVVLGFADSVVDFRKRLVAR